MLGSELYSSDLTELGSDAGGCDSSNNHKQLIQSIVKAMKENSDFLKILENKIDVGKYTWEM